MDAARVLDLLADLEALGIQLWLDGGWAVDALLGEQTRPHDDLDLVSRLEDSAQIEKALGARGYVQAGGGLPHSFELVDAEGHQVDVHPAAFNPDGDGVYQMVGGGEWIFPASGFGGVGRILGRAVPCLTPEVVAGQSHDRLRTGRGARAGRARARRALQPPLARVPPAQLTRGSSGMRETSS